MRNWLRPLKMFHSYHLQRCRSLSSVLLSSASLDAESLERVFKKGEGAVCAFCCCCFILHQNLMHRTALALTRTICKWWTLLLLTDRMGKGFISWNAICVQNKQSHSVSQGQQLKSAQWEQSTQYQHCRTQFTRFLSKQAPIAEYGQGTI